MTLLLYTHTTFCRCSVGYMKKLLILVCIHSGRNKGQKLVGHFLKIGHFIGYWLLSHWKCTGNLAKQNGLWLAKCWNWLENGQWLAGISSTIYVCTIMYNSGAHTILIKQSVVYKILYWFIHSHYLVVVVIGSLPSTFTAPRDIPDNQLLPYDKAAMREYNYYVATGGRLVNDTHVLGNGKTITIDSTEYYNRHLNPDQQYSYFVRIYSKHVSWFLAEIDEKCLWHLIP